MRISVFFVAAFVVACHTSSHDDVPRDASAVAVDCSDSAPAITGSANSIAKFTGSSLASSSLTDDGTTLAVGSGQLAVTEATGDLTIAGRFTEAATAANGFSLSPRTSVPSFAVPSLRPAAPDSVLAFDLMPNGTPGENPDAGFAWFDICDKDILTTTPPIECGRFGIKSNYVEVGARAYYGGVLLPLALTVGGTPLLTLQTSGNVTVTNSMQIGNHLVSTGPAVAFSNCGTGPDCNSSTCNDLAGTFTTGVGANACTITFASTYNRDDDAGCIVQAISSASVPNFFTTATTISMTVALPQQKYHYVCIGH